jgi:hypothetical protein
MHNAMLLQGSPTQSLKSAVENQVQQQVYELITYQMYKSILVSMLTNSVYFLKLVMPAFLFNQR